MKIYYKLPAEEINDETAVISSIYYKNGEYIKKGDLIYSFETTKTLVDVTAENDGYIFYAVEQGCELSVGEVVCVLADDKDFLLNIPRCTESLNKDKKFILTKKAQELVIKNNIDLSKFKLQGIVKEKDILQLLSYSVVSSTLQNKSISKLDNNNSFVKYLINSADEFKKLDSEDKIKRYKEHGHSLGKNNIFQKGSIIIGNKISLSNNITIGENVYIEAVEVVIKENAYIGDNTHIVASKINIGSYTKFGNRVKIDISGGRYFDSDFICGKGCLLADEVYINVCREVLLEDNVALSPRSMVFTHSYWQNILDGYKVSFHPVLIKENSWIGACAQVLPNVKIGRGSIVMSGSVVINDVTDYTLVGGIPATIIKEQLAKKLTFNQARDILVNLFNEFAIYLETDGYKIKKLSEHEFICEEKDKARNIKLILNKDMITTKENLDIVICSDEVSRVSDLAKESFIINNRKILGVMSDMGKQIVEFFRRRGIRFFQ